MSVTTWRDSLLPASFRGVSFEVEQASMPTGQRGQLHEFVQRDDPFSFSAAFRLGRNNPGDPAETWHEHELDGLPVFTGATINMDCIDPADPNLQYPGPDGRIEVKFSGDPEP